jgi:hypothetical protein
LQYLELFSNKLTGSIPSSFCGLSQASHGTNGTNLDCHSS